MKKILVAAFLSLVALVALALPKPSQIEDALAAGRYADARSMVQEVLREKPDSARAHLMNAYLLVHVDRNAKAAAVELDTARGLDKKGDVKTSPLYGRVVTEIEAVPSTRPAPARTVTHHYADEFARNTLILFGLLALVIGVMWAIVSWISRPRPSVLPQDYRPHDDGGARSWGAPVSPAPAPAPAVAIPSASASYYATPVAQREPLGAMGTAASVAGGVVAGNAISDMLRHSRDDDYERRRRDERRSDDDYLLQQQVATASQSSVSYESSRESFSSSSSGSSSWDSGSSSSSDSGSSGGDW